MVIFINSSGKMPTGASDLLIWLQAMQECIIPKPHCYGTIHFYTLLLKPIEGRGCYYELEVNAANTVYEVFFIWKDAYEKGGRFDTAQFDVHQLQAYTFGGDYDRAAGSFWKGTHPRGIRWAFTNFDMPGLQTAVQVEGTLNDNSDIDKGWSLEIAIPWSSLQLLDSERTIPPVQGDVWNMFLGRFQKLMTGGKEVIPHPAMVLNSHGIYDTHLTEKWSKIEFVL